MPWPDRAIAALSAGQQGLITRRQLLSLGVTPASIARAVARGRLHRIHDGVYALVQVSALAPLALEQAALLACGPRAMLSHGSAMALWGLCPPAPGPVSVTVIGHRRRRPGIETHSARVLDRRDRRRHRGLLVTAPARTVLDRAPALSDRELERAVDEALVRHLTSRSAIREMLQRHSGRPHASRLCALLDPGRPTTVTRSEAEERLLALVRRGGLPTPDCNVVVEGLEVDALWRRERVVVEVDGYATHGGRPAFERDRSRDARLQTAGYVVIRVSWRQLVDEPETVLVLIASTLARRT